MKITETVYAKDRKEWHRWLAKNHKRKHEIWLIYYRKATGKKRIPYNDAIEEALCYGWIDSIAKRIDDERFAQRFSKRRPASVLSQMNLERVRKLIAQKKMTKAGLAAISHVFDPKDVKPAPFRIPSGILKALKSDKIVWQNFQKYPESYKRVRVAYVESRKRHGLKRYSDSLKYLIKRTRENKLFGFVRPDKL